MNAFVALSLAIVSTSCAQVTYRWYFLRRRFVILGAAIALFCIAPPMSYLAMKTYSLSTVYMSTALTYVLTLGLAAALLKERLGRREVSGVACILAGTVLFTV